MIIEMPAYFSHVLPLYFLSYMDPYTMNMMSGISMATHISLLHASMVAHIQDPFSEFHSVRIGTCRML